MRTTEDCFNISYCASSNFFISSRETYYLKRRTENRVGETALIGFVYSWTARFVIAFGTTSVASAYFSKSEYFVKNLNNTAGPLFVIFCLALVVGTIFMNLFSTVCDSILIGFRIKEVSFW